MIPPSASPVHILLSESIRIAVTPEAALNILLNCPS